MINAPDWLNYELESHELFTNFIYTSKEITPEFNRLTLIVSNLINSELEFGIPVNLVVMKMENTQVEWKIGSPTQEIDLA